MTELAALSYQDRIIAHRGASAYAPENTLASFERALAFGCRRVEFDVMLSADGQPFVFHDEELSRTTNGRGNVSQMSAAYLRQLDAGAWFSDAFKGEKIPEFFSVLEWLQCHSVSANIEIKPNPGTTAATTVAVLTHLNQYWPLDKPLPLVSSFDWEALTLCRSLSPELPLGLLMHEWQTNGILKAQELACVSMHLNAKIITPARIRSIKEAGFLVYVYTVNQARLAKQLLGLGVDAVFSDYPDLLGCAC